jgi:hypothetical protein
MSDSTEIVVDVASSDTSRALGKAEQLFVQVLTLEQAKRRLQRFFRRRLRARELGSLSPDKVERTALAIAERSARIQDDDPCRKRTTPRAVPAETVRKSAIEAVTAERRREVDVDIRERTKGLRNAGKIEQRYAEDLESLMNLSVDASIHAELCAMHERPRVQDLAPWARLHAQHIQELHGCVQVIKHAILAAAASHAALLAEQRRNEDPRSMDGFALRGLTSDGAAKFQARVLRHEKAMRTLNREVARAKAARANVFGKTCGGWTLMTDAGKREWAVIAGEARRQLAIGLEGALVQAQVFQTALAHPLLEMKSLLQRYDGAPASFFKVADLGYEIVAAARAVLDLFSLDDPFLSRLPDELRDEFVCGLCDDAAAERVKRGEYSRQSLTTIREAMGLLEQEFRAAVAQVIRAVPHEVAVDHGSRREVKDGLAMLARTNSDLICDQVLLDCSWTRMRISVNDSLELAWPGVARPTDRGRNFSYLPQHTGMGRAMTQDDSYDTNDFGPEFAKFTFRRRQRPVRELPLIRSGGWKSAHSTITGPPCLPITVPDLID